MTALADANGRAFEKGEKICARTFITITHWNDSNVVIFLDNGIPSGREHWDTMEVNQGADREIVHVPEVAELYKEIYGWVDRGNQQLSYYSTEFRNVRKQNRILDSLIEMYVLVNGHTFRLISLNLMCNITRENMPQREFRFPGIEVFYYPVNKQTHHRRSLAMTVTSPRNGPITYKEFPLKILQEKIEASNAAYVARKHPSNAASVQALGTL